MNKILIAFLMVLNTTFLFSQPYKSIFGNNKTLWNISSEYIDVFTTDSIITSTDTIIDALNYKIINQLSFYSFGKFYVREDTNTGKYYIRNFNNIQKEYLFMDMSLNVGDTFVIKDNPYFFHDSIAVVDSVYYISNLKIIKTNLQIFTQTNNYFDFLYFYESIGPNNGLSYFFQNSFGEHNYTLLCQFKDDTLYYHNYSALESEPCYFIGAYIAENNYLLKNLYPNPFSDNIIFEFKKPFKDISIRIYNSMGAVAAIKNVQNCDKIEVNTASFSRGIYFYSVVYDNRIIDSGKIIKD